MSIITDFHMYELGEQIELHPVPFNEDYGIKWPVVNGWQTSQLVKELYCIKLSRIPSKNTGVRGTFYHMINAVRMLWDETIDIFAIASQDITYTGKDEKVFNTYFLNALSFCCRNKSCCLTGPASAAKTFAVSVYNLVSYYSDPCSTMCMISTTSGAASEARIWGDIKELHRTARFDLHSMRRADMGVIIDYLKCLTFDPDVPMNPSDDSSGASSRDLRNGVQVIPIPKDSKGEQALNTIMGRKNSFVFWSIDELPAMMDGVLRPRSNLIHNPFCQIIGIGNAHVKTDPHGVACRPRGGWKNKDINENGSKVWEAETLDVIYLDGEESPNDSPLIDQSKVVVSLNFPFPYLSNSLSRRETAKVNGNGDIERGKLTIDYMRFAKGFWYGSSVENTIISDEFVESYNADDVPLPYKDGRFDSYASLDPGWASGGDANSVTIIKCGVNVHGRPQIEVENESLQISPLSTDRGEYRRLVAKELVRILKGRKVRINNFCIDINGDGGLMLAAITEEYGESGAMGLSSLEPSSSDKYADRVTQYWFSVREMIETGFVRGFNLNSNYSEDLKSRRFSSVTQGKVKVETKKEMKKRIHRSPDNGDSFSYCSYLVMTKFGMARKRKSREGNSPATRNLGGFDFMTGERSGRRQSDYSKSLSY